MCHWTYQRDPTRRFNNSVGKWGFSLGESRAVCETWKLSPLVPWERYGLKHTEFDPKTKGHQSLQTETEVHRTFMKVTLTSDKNTDEHE